MKLIEELKRRNVIRVAGLYGVVGWLLAQAASLMESALGLPNWFDAVVISFLMILARSYGTSTFRPPLAIPDLRNRTFGRRWKLSTTTGSERRIQIPPPRGMKFRGEKHHRITVVAPTGHDRTCRIQVRDFITR